MKKLLMITVMMAMVVGIGFSIPATAVAGSNVYTEKIEGMDKPISPRFERVTLTAHNSPPEGCRTVRTVVGIVAGFNICYWGKPGMTFEKKVAIQRWEHPNGEDAVYNLFMPDKRTALACIKNRDRLAAELANWRIQLDKRTPGTASVGSQVWIDLHLQNFLATLNPS